MTTISMSPNPISAHHRSAARYRKNLSLAIVKEEDFEVKLSPCQAGACKGACCSHGFYPEEDEAQDLLEVVNSKRKELEALGVQFPESVLIEEQHPTFGTVTRMALRPEPFSKEVANYPEHFPDTACMFLLKGGYCAFQVLANNEGKHKWFYKPILCVLYPLILHENDDGSFLLTIYDPAKDPEKSPEYFDFNPYTPCGKICSNGVPAKEVVKEEWEYMEQLKE